MIKVGVGVIVQNPSGEILIAKRLSGTSRVGYWAVPGGSIKNGESILDAACREVREETGLEIDKATAVIYPSVSQEYDSQSGDHRIGFYVIARVDDDSTLCNPEPDKHTDWVWNDPDDLPEPMWPYMSRVLSHEPLPRGLILG